MESKGTLKDVSRDWKSGKMCLTFEMDTDVSQDIDRINGKPLRISAKRWREKRSLDANAYYHVLLAKFADAIRVSKPCAHNLMLRRYGQILTIDGNGVYIRIPDTEKAENDALESSTFHIRPTSQTVAGKYGVNYRTYTMLKGSSEYDSGEMSTLINGLVDECKQLGIETLPPEELERMMDDYAQYHASR